jgi:cyclic pyranopterin phosphate synthase
MDNFSHIDKEGRIKMVDVSRKNRTEREAVAVGKITMKRETVAAVQSDELPKGNVITTAQVAGVQAAKQTAALIPLCHPLSITWVDVRISSDDDGFAIESCVKATDATGVEMEALTAVAVAALTLYDMCKAVDETMQISGIRLINKSGGKTGK